jgi:hypothetical protein
MQTAIKACCLSIFVAGLGAALSTSFAVDARASRAGVQGRSGTIAFLRTVGDGPTSLFAVRGERPQPSAAHAQRLGRRLLRVGAGWEPDRLPRPARSSPAGSPDGTGRELLAASSPLRSPWFLSWSPHGNAIAVDARDPGAPPRPKWDTSIQLISTSGGAPLLLPSGAAQELTWSPRGDEIVYGSAGGRIRIIRTDGSKARPFFVQPQKQGFGTPTWSSDGTHIGFGGHVRHGPWYNGIYVADADGRNLHLLTSRAYNEYGFAWSPDGRNILYGREHREGTYVIGADGRNDHRLTRDWPTPTEFPTLTWAPDGRSVGYATDLTGNGDIYVISADGHNRVRLTSSAAHDGSPSWQPQ